MTGGLAQPSGPALVIGQTGQLARELETAAGRAGVKLAFAGRQEVDLANTGALAGFISQAAPAAVINAAAYTAVDHAETETDAAMAANCIGPGAMATACARLDIPLVHISTDYIFNGRSSMPYKVDDTPDPQSSYGRSKLAGENAVRAVLDKHFILRTSWLYSPYGTNFLRTMVRLGGERDHLSVVDDQTGSPTYAGDLADAILVLVKLVTRDPAKAPYGTYHVTNSGSTTWFGFAEAIFAIRAQQGHTVPALEAISTADYPTPAPRPAYSVLDMSLTVEQLGVTMPDWRDGLARCMGNMIEPEISKRGALC